MVAINFEARFADAVASGDKRQTIRLPRKPLPIVAGDRLQLYTGQRTKACRKLADAVCTSTLSVTVKRHKLFVGGLPLEGYDREAFAHADGFENFDRMAQWFADRYGLPFRGVLIRWEREEEPRQMTLEWTDTGETRRFDYRTYDVARAERDGFVFELLAAPKNRGDKWLTIRKAAETEPLYRNRFNKRAEAEEIAEGFSLPEYKAAQIERRKRVLENARSRLEDAEEALAEAEAW